MTSIFKVYCVLVLCFTAAIASNETYKLLFVQILYRHGDRSPAALYPNDPNPLSVWPRGLAQLTLLGKKQHYGLGKLLHYMYENFTSFSPMEISVLSSFRDRCLESAAANLASFFAPNEEWQFDEGINWQPIPINYHPEHDDKYVYSLSPCPRYFQEMKRSYNSPEAQAFLTNYKETLDSLILNSGYPLIDPPDWYTYWKLYDALWIEKRYNLTIPDWVEPHWDKFIEFSEPLLYWLSKSPVINRLRAGPLLEKMIDMMQAKINGSLPHLKFQVYSSHDTTLHVMLQSLNFHIWRLQPYCATLIFELYIDPNDSPYLRLLYLNSTEPEKVHQVPHILKLDGCEEFCPLQYFVNYTQDLYPVDWKSECQAIE